MDHRFYIKSKKEQTKIQLQIVLLALLIIIIALCFSWFTGIYFIATLISVIVLTILAPFIDTPKLKKSGKLIYYSSLFITERPKNGIIRIHGGTLFDYVFVLKHHMNGKQRTNFILQKQIEGVLALIETYENTNSDTNLKIIGTSYIINERTARRIGFKISETEILQKMILIFNYFNILLTNSIAKKKLSFPNLSKTKTFETDLKQLINNKTTLTNLNNALIRNLKHS
ncbi:hypothetical protein [uncultured Formosa sp.]|uniref:hypothetical protein n=1 Tax=uncultured Formosa sp. TaxID=255435 RepID=UPI00261C7096|nr:hypothetical protein [uncultured Formosa sp.]